MSINDELVRLEEVINYKLKHSLKRHYLYQEKIIHAMEYSLFTGGKRLRPIMALKSFELFSDDIDKVLPFAIAIEMIHTYSLVHDDLPAMDNDDFRRGKPTNHKVFGEAMAILTGDALLNLAFEILSDYILDNSNTLYDYKKNIRAMKEISSYSGVDGMIGGQVVDLLTSHENMFQDKLIYMYKTKTAALIQASIVCGAIVGGASEEEIQALRNFGLYLGLAYQIRDDILDDKQDSEINKPTYLNYYNKPKAEEEVVNLSNKAIESLDLLKGRNTLFFKELTEILISRKI